jgi:hypothetical protein
LRAVSGDLLRACFRRDILNLKSGWATKIKMRVDRLIAELKSTSSVLAEAVGG